MGFGERTKNVLRTKKSMSHRLGGGLPRKDGSGEPSVTRVLVEDGEKGAKDGDPFLPEHVPLEPMPLLLVLGDPSQENRRIILPFAGELVMSCIEAAGGVGDFMYRPINQALLQHRVTKIRGDVEWSTFVSGCQGFLDPRRQPTEEAISWTMADLNGGHGDSTENTATDLTPLSGASSGTPWDDDNELVDLDCDKIEFVDTFDVNKPSNGIVVGRNGQPVDEVSIAAFLKANATSLDDKRGGGANVVDGLQHLRETVRAAEMVCITLQRQTLEAANKLKNVQVLINGQIENRHDMMFRHMRKHRFASIPGIERCTEDLVAGGGGRIKNYEIEQFLGEGAFGSVRMGRNVETGKKVAIKIMVKQKLMDLNSMDLLESEVKIVQLLKHNNIVRLVEVIHTNKHLHVVFEYVGGGNLFEYARDRGGELTEAQIRHVFGQICCAIEYCHGRNICHRDLKPENVLMEFEEGKPLPIVKLADFGFAVKFSPGKMLSEYCGSSGFLAPEMIKVAPYDGATADVWSLGAILVEMSCGQKMLEKGLCKLGYNDSTDISQAGQYVEEIVKHMTSIKRCNDMIGLLKKLLVVAPKGRLPSRAILQQPFFQGFQQPLTRRQSTRIIRGSSLDRQDSTRLSSFGKNDSDSPKSDSGSPPPMVLKKKASARTMAGSSLLRQRSGSSSLSSPSNSKLLKQRSMGASAIQKQRGAQGNLSPTTLSNPKTSNPRRNLPGIGSSPMSSSPMSSSPMSGGLTPKRHF